MIEEENEDELVRPGTATDLGLSVDVGHRWEPKVWW